MAIVATIFREHQAPVIPEQCTPQNCLSVHARRFRQLFMRTETSGNDFAVSRPECYCIRIENKFRLRLRRVERPQGLSRSPARPQHDVPTSTVMNEDRRLPCQHIVCVDVCDRQVMNALLCGPPFDRLDLNQGASGRAQPHAGRELLGVDPLVKLRHPEGMLIGRYDDAGGLTLLSIRIDGDLNQALFAVAHDEVDDLLGFRFAGFRIGGENFISDLNIFDRLAGAVGHEHFGIRREAVLAAYQFTDELSGIATYGHHAGQGPCCFLGIALVHGLEREQDVGRGADDRQIAEGFELLRTRRPPISRVPVQSYSGARCLPLVDLAVFIVILHRRVVFRVGVTDGNRLARRAWVAFDAGVVPAIRGLVLRVVPRTRLVTVVFDVGDGVAAGKGVAVAGPGVEGEGQVLKGAVIGIEVEETVEAGIVVAEPHVVHAGGVIPALAVEAVGVVLLLGRGIDGIGFVNAREEFVVVTAVGGVAVGGAGVAVLLGDLLDVGVRVVAVIGRLFRTVGVDLHLGQPLAPGAVLEGLGELAGHFLVQHLGGQSEVGEGGGLGARGAFLLGLGRRAVQRVVGVAGHRGRDAVAAEFLVLDDVVEAVVGVLLQRLAGGLDGAQPAVGVVGEGGSLPVGDRRHQGVCPVNGVIRS
uniref:Uncharacterized protein n=1 Tax=Nonomuraea gerenzanensis TaxID=93944 RepID=A0A1M4EQH7_9ACTN|nr:hypothetical protein BN4615_P10594 [Nonomuraea gerenzanensis]